MNNERTDYLGRDNMNKFLDILKNKISGSKEAKNAIWIIGGRVIQMGLSFFVGILTARYLGPGNYGIINYAAAYVAFFTSFCTLGINSVIIKDFVDYPDEQGEAIGTTLCLRAISSLLSAIMIVCIVSVIDHNEPITIIVTVLCSIALVFQIADTLNYWFQYRYQSKVSAIATLFSYIVTSAYRIFLLITQKDIKWFAFATSIDYICVAIVLFISYKKYNGPKLSFSKKKAKELLSKSYNYILASMMVAIYGQTDKLMLKQMLDETSVGYYSLASTINNMWVFVLAAIIDSIYPTIITSAKVNKEQFERKNRQLYAIIIYVSLFVAILFMLFGKLIIRILYGEEYLPAVMPLRIVCWYTIFSYLGTARNAWIVSTNNQRYLKYMYGGAAVANVILNWILIPIWGASGAAFASLLTQMATILFIPFLIKEMRPNVKLMIDAFFLRNIK